MGTWVAGKSEMVVAVWGVGKRCAQNSPKPSKTFQHTPLTTNSTNVFKTSGEVLARNLEPMCLVTDKF